MSYKLSNPCLGVIFRKITPRRVSGHRIFESFIEENRLCFWNFELIEAINNLDYVGFIKPSTLFVSSSQERYLKVLRSAWSKRLLKAAKGFVILSLGDVGGIQLHEVEQMEFVPLADMLCNEIAKFNRIGLPATFDSLLHEISDQYPSIAKPSVDTFRESIAKLLKCGLIYRMGGHFFVSMPIATPYHTAKANEPVKISKECQTGNSIIQKQSPNKKRPDTTKTRKGLLARLFAKKDGIPPKNLPKRKEPLTFSVQFPPPEWICKPDILKTSDKIFNNDLAAPTTQRFCAFADKFWDDAYRKKHRTRRRRDDIHISSSSECLNYGPIDPPELLPYYHEAEGGVRDRRSKRRTQKCRFDYRNVFLATTTAKTSAIPSTSTPIARRSDSFENAVVSPRKRSPSSIDNLNCATIVTQKAPQRGSDSAYSLSPLVTENSANSRERSNSMSTANENRSSSSCCITQKDHTYMNLNMFDESTKFERITLFEKSIPSTLHISSV